MMPISAARLRLLSDFLAAQMGLRLAQTRWQELERAVQCIARARGYRDLDRFADHLMSQPLARDDIAVLARQLSVGETYFFRDPALFTALEQHILPPLIAARRAAADRRLSIWSAGCSSGEELYSLAIVLSRLLPDARDWDLRLVGTDIDPGALAKAKSGVYRDWSFRSVLPTLRRDYFRPCGDGGFAVLPALQQQTHFAYHNLAGTDAPPMLPAGGFDLVLCRNVLMYFDDTVIDHAVQRLEVLLADEGWLVVSAAESGHPAFSRYAPVFYRDTLLYRRPKANTTRCAAAPDLAEYSIERLPVMPPAEAQPNQAQPDEQAPRYSSAPNRRRTGSATPADGRTSTAPAPHPHDKAQRMAQRARTLANRGALEHALRWARAAVATDKCDASLRYLLALIHNEQGRVAEAAASLKHALYLDPDFALAHLGLANIYRALARHHDARRHLDIAAALLRALPDAHPLAHTGGLAAGHLRGWTGLADRQGQAT